VRKVHCKRTAGAGADIGPERLAAFIQLALAYGRDAPAQPLVDAMDVVEKLLERQRRFGKVDQMRRVILSPAFQWRRPTALALRGFSPPNSS